jgi:SHS2 domain-containing protein
VTRRFEFVDDVTSDVSFEARGETLEDLFAAAAEALLAVTLADPAGLGDAVARPLELEEPDVELLLLRFLGELVFLRDARGLLLRAGSLRISPGPPARLEGELRGEPLDAGRHVLEADVKAVTAYGLRVLRQDGGWCARVTLDV